MRRSRKRISPYPTVLLVLAFTNFKLHWRRLRILVWIVLIFFLILVTVATYSSQFASLVYYGIIGGASVGAFVIIVLVIPAIAFGISVKRSRDATLRRHLTWFGVGIGALIAGVVLTGVTPGSIILGYLAFGYCLYRSAKTLAPGAQDNCQSDLRISPIES